MLDGDTSEVDGYSQNNLAQRCGDNNTENNKILGAHILGHNSEEVINIFTLVIRLDPYKEKIKNMLISCPINSYDINYML